jgi:2-polyprenyl-3-methyl-5-hydroxy-6-metoxy-1,4-benzoquinol methylase
MNKTTVARVFPRVVAPPRAAPLTQAIPIKQNMGLYTSPRVDMVEHFLHQYGEQRPIPVADILPVLLMNYGEVEFHNAQTWFEAGAEALGQHHSLSLIDVGAGFGPASLVFGARHYKVTAIELQADIAAVGQRVAQACGLQDHVHYAVTDVMAFAPQQPADTLISVLCLLHVPDKAGVMQKLAAFLRTGGRGYLADFYAKGALSVQEQALLKHEVACPGLLTKEAYIGALQEAGFTRVHFEDVTAEYATFVHQRLTTALQQDPSAQCEALLRFFSAMDTLYRSGDGESSRLGGCRVYLER